MAWLPQSAILCERRRNPPGLGGAQAWKRIQEVHLETDGALRKPPEQTSKAMYGIVDFDTMVSRRRGSAVPEPQGDVAGWTSPSTDEAASPQTSEVNPKDGTPGSSKIQPNAS